MHIIWVLTLPLAGMAAGALAYSRIARKTEVKPDSEKAKKAANFMEEKDKKFKIVGPVAIHQGVWETCSMWFELWYGDEMIVKTTPRYVSGLYEFANGYAYGKGMPHKFKEFIESGGIRSKFYDAKGNRVSET